jgi:hypothetical protein
MRWQYFTTRGGGYAYVVGRAEVGRNPNVTVNGPITYALEGTKFYILDDDGRVFQLSLSEKKLLAPSDEKSKGGGWFAVEPPGGDIREALLLAHAA